MKYGLDLMGGVHFLMQVDTDRAVLDRLEGLEQEIKRTLRTGDERIRYKSSEILPGLQRIGFASSRCGIAREVRSKKTLANSSSRKMTATNIIFNSR